MQRSIKMQTVPFGNVSPSVWRTDDNWRVQHTLEVFLVPAVRLLNSPEAIARSRKRVRPPGWARVWERGTDTLLPLQLRPACPVSRSSRAPSLTLAPGCLQVFAGRLPISEFSCFLFLLSSKFSLLQFWCSAEPLMQLLNWFLQIFCLLL